MRGRVSAVNSVFIDMSNELGGFESGALAAAVGPVVAVVGGGIGTISSLPVSPTHGRSFGIFETIAPAVALVPAQLQPITLTRGRSHGEHGTLYGHGSRVGHSTLRRRQSLIHSMSAVELDEFERNPRSFFCQATFHSCDHLVIGELIPRSVDDRQLDFRGRIRQPASRSASLASRLPT